MSSDQVAVRVKDVSKHYLMFDRPEDRLKQSIVPRLQRLVGRLPRQYYRDFAALDRVSFEIRRGETVGIVGRNGSGKSTLLQIICGTLQPTTGTVEVNGRIAALLELGAGFNPEFTGRENVYMNGAILGLSRPEIDARFDEIARFADIGLFIEQPVKTYSSGMYLRLAFAVAVCVDPDILVVDEALAVGDEAFQRKCFARIEEIQSRGATILFVSHAGPTIVQLCSRAMLIDRGELIFQGRPKTVVGQYQRLANASSEAAQEIRVAIIGLRDGPPAEPELSTAAPFLDEADSINGHAVDLLATLAAPPNTNAPHADYYDPGLRSQSTVFLEERGASIRDVRILTLKGEKVNVLQMGRRYVFEYYVDFGVDAANVGFGMWFRTITGIGLGGAQTIFSKPHRTARITAGAVARVRFEFTNILLPGVYFISCGLFGTPGSSPDQIVMHRIIDLCAIRVSTEPHLLATGFIDVAAEPSIAISRRGNGVSLRSST